MKPLKLVTRAVGPYPDEEVLDFRLLADRTLFLIHGPTGAGKTTILDAISFALYGVCSGNERDVKRLRSDHADPSVVTEVTFDFKLGGEDYRVYRRPEQQRPKKRGEGTTTVRADAHLWKRTGLNNDSEEGKLIAGQWNRVTEAVESLLGFRSDQFSQVVMLPQGQFRKLLLADSRERQAILEVLFQTALYRRIEEALKQAAKSLATDIREKNTRREFILERAGAETAAHLDEAHESAKAESERIRATLDCLKIAEHEAQENLNRGRGVTEKLEEVMLSRQALEAFQSRVTLFDEKRRSLDEARKATAIAGEEKALEQRQSEADLADKKLKAAREALGIATAARDKAAEKVAAETARQPELEEARRELTRLEELTRQVAELAVARERLAVAQEREKMADRRLETVTGMLEECVGRIETTKGLLEEARNRASQQEVLRMRSLEAERAYGQLRKLAVLRADKTDLGKKLEGTITRLTKAEKDAAKALSEHKLLQKAWIEGQAAILAAGLSPGSPCPVCGSVDHPQPARTDLELPNEALLEVKSQDAERLRALYEDIAGQKIGLEAKLLGIQAAAAEVTDTLGETAEKGLGELQGELNRMKKELKAAEEAARIASDLEKETAKVEKNRSEAEKQLEEALQHKRVAEAERVKAMAEVDTRISGIPEEFQEMAALNRAKVRTGKRVRELQKAFDSASQELAQAKEQVSARNAALDAAKEDAALTSSRAMKAREEFAQSLLKADFQDYERFRASKKSAAEIQRLEKEIDDFQHGLAAAGDRLLRAEQSAEGLAPPDMASLESSAFQAKEALEKAWKQSTGLDREVERLRGLVSDLQKVSSHLDALEARYEVVGKISEVAGGVNREGITFQRFVLAALLDDVLFAATERLRIMSNGRYGLQRVTVRTDRRTSFGLDLEVEDAYTGTARPVSTLSGGESFLASLSLALGLADVVQAYAGGIHLDTIFVDEGFGSLDPEALDLAFRALVDLQSSGRLVGIISHVPELRERIDTRLEITTDRRGSKARFVIG